MKRTKSIAFFTLKAAISISLLVIVCEKVDFSVFNRHVNGAQATSLLFGLVLLLINIVLVTVRWWLLLQRLGIATMPFSYTLICNYASVFIGQVTPGTIGTDAVRGWLCYHRGAPLRLVVTSLLTDRLLAVLGILVMVGIVGLWQFQAIGHTVETQIVSVVCLLLILAAVGLWLLPVALERGARKWPWLRRLKELHASFCIAAWSGAGAAGLALSCLILVLTINAVILFAQALGVSVTPTVVYLVVPLVILASAVPISIAGWGLREASLAYGLALLGAVPQDDAALLGLMLGVGLLLVSLPGGIALLLLGKQVRTAIRGPMSIDR